MEFVSEERKEFDSLEAKLFYGFLEGKGELDKVYRK